MPMKKLKEFLDANGVKYVAITHSPAYTAQEIAASAHIPGKEMVKTVMVKVDGEIAMAVMPATEKVDLERLRGLIGAKQLELATEEEFGGLFPDCELGAMPPFGNLWDMQVFVAPNLARDEKIAFNAGSHTELVQMAYADFERLVAPRVLEFSSGG